MSIVGASVRCRNCQIVCVWGRTEAGWILMENGSRHICDQKPNMPIERSEMQLLSRQVARLATAVENLTEELRELRDAKHR